MAAQRGRKFVFPRSEDRSLASPNVLCPAERVLALFNQDSGEQAQRIVKKVKEWFYGAAHRAGWDGVHFVPDVQSNHGAGCIMWVSFDVGRQVQVTQQVLVLEDSDEGADK